MIRGALDIGVKGGSCGKKASQNRVRSQAFSPRWGRAKTTLKIKTESDTFFEQGDVAGRGF